MAPYSIYGKYNSVIKMSSQPRKQRLFYHTAPLHIRKKMMGAHLADDLIIKYKRRTMPVVRGDTVKIVRGQFRGQSGKVRKVMLRKQRIEVEGITIKKADGKSVPYFIHPSNVVITKLNLTDPWRRSKIEERLSEEAKKEVEKEAEEQIEEMKREAEKAEMEEEEEQEEVEIEKKEEQREEQEVKEETGEEEAVEEQPEEQEMGEAKEEKAEKSVKEEEAEETTEQQEEAQETEEKTEEEGEQKEKKKEE